MKLATGPTIIANDMNRPQTMLETICRELDISLNLKFFLVSIIYA